MDCAYFLVRPLGKERLRGAESSECQENDAGATRGYRLLGEFYLAPAILRRQLPNTLCCISSIPRISLFEKRYIELLIRDKQLEPASKLNELSCRELSDTDALVTKGQILNRQQKSAEAIPILESVARNTLRTR